MNIKEIAIQALNDLLIFYAPDLFNEHDRMEGLERVHELGVVHYITEAMEKINDSARTNKRDS